MSPRAPQTTSETAFEAWCSHPGLDFVRMREARATGQKRPDYAHSILSTHRNALIFKRKIFLLTVKARPSSRRNFSLMISKENSRASNSATFQRLSTTIGRFFTPSTL
jgi:hypothetical protein